MINASIIDQTTFIAFWLCFTRVMSVFIHLPIVDNQSIPGILKILISLILAFTFFPYVKGPILADITYYGVDSFWMLTAGYALSGLFVGFLIQIIMQIFIASGALMTQQIGFTTVSYFDPTFVANVGPMEKIIQYTLIIMVLTSGALIPMFKGMILSFESINLLNLSRLINSTTYYTSFFKSVFTMSILLATPILFSTLLLNVVLGIIARTVPQMNVLMVSFVVNIGIGLLVFLAISHEYFRVAFKMYVDKLGNWFLYIT